MSEVGIHVGARDANVGDLARRDARSTNARLVKPLKGLRKDKRHSIIIVPDEGLREEEQRPADIRVRWTKHGVRVRDVRDHRPISDNDCLPRNRDAESCKAGGQAFSARCAQCIRAQHKHPTHNFSAGRIASYSSKRPGAAPSRQSSKAPD